MRATRIVFKKSCRAVLRHVQLFATPWTITLQAPLSMGFSLQENWSGMPFPPSGDLPDPGVKPTSPASHALAGGFFTIEPLGKPSRNHNSLSLSRGLPYSSDGKESACNAGDPGLKNHQFSSVQSPFSNLQDKCITQVHLSFIHSLFIDFSPS